MAGAAVHEEVDHALGAAREVRRSWRKRTALSGRGCLAGLGGEKMGEGHTADPTTGVQEELSAANRGGKVASINGHGLITFVERSL